MEEEGMAWTQVAVEQCLPCFLKSVSLLAPIHLRLLQFLAHPRHNHVCIMDTMQILWSAMDLYIHNDTHDHMVVCELDLPEQTHPNK